MKHVSLCSGIGGLELALGTPDAFFEIDAAPSEVLAARFPSVPNHGDWTQLDKFEDTVTLVSGGLPCQPLSGAGKGKGDADERYLFDELVRILRASDVRPQLVLENVRGILYPRNGQALWRFISALADLGYVGQWEIVRASDAGAPHKRERWFCVARHADGKPAGRHGGSAPRTQAQVGKDGRDGNGSADADRAAPHPRRSGRLPGPGFGASEAPEVRHDGFSDDDGRLAALLASRFGPAVERWEHLTRPSPPPLASGRLSPRWVEWMMGFPEGWTEPLGRTKALKALGNAVVPQQAALALEILGVTSGRMERVA